MNLWMYWNVYDEPPQYVTATEISTEAQHASRIAAFFAEQQLRN